MIELVWIYGAFACAHVITRKVKDSAALEKVIKHFMNYAALGVLAWLLLYWHKQLQRLGPEDPWAWTALLAFTALSSLAGGLALSNFYFGWRSIAESFKESTHSIAKTLLVRILYAFLLLNVWFLWSATGFIGSK